MNLFKLILIIAVVGTAVYFIHDYKQQGAATLYPTPGEDQLPNHTELIESIGPRLVKPNGQTVSTEELAKRDYVMLYFSAGWCGPCKRFTPNLNRYYEQNQDKGNFEVLLVSSDRNPQDMLGYMNSSKMPFAAIPFDRIRTSGLPNKYGGRGIPHLVLVDQYGNIVSNTVRGGDYVGPQRVLEDMDTLIANREQKTEEG